MPKVTDEYRTGKKGFILECTGEILKQKPLYQLTMRDIIQKAAFSQGVIYRYYTNLDEILVEYINQNTTYTLLEQSMDAILHSACTEKEILIKCILAIGKYIEELLKSVGGRTCFEFIVLYAYDVEKRAEIFPKLKFKQSLEYAQSKLVEFVLRNVEAGVFQPQIPIHSIILFTGSFIDGAVQSVVTRATERNGDLADISTLFQALATAIAGLLNA